MENGDWQMIKAFNTEDNDAAGSSAAVPKRRYPYGNNETDVKRRRTWQNSFRTVHTEIYHPIANLPGTQMQQSVKGTVTSMTGWVPYPGKDATCMYFRLRDESGEIPGIVYEPMSDEFKRKFMLDAEVIIENPKVQFIREIYRKTDDEYQIVVNRDTKIRVEPPLSNSCVKEPPEMRVQAPTPIESRNAEGNESKSYCSSGLLEKSPLSLANPIQIAGTSVPNIRIKEEPRSPAFGEAIPPNVSSQTGKEVLPLKAFPPAAAMSSISTCSTAAIRRRRRTPIKTVLERIDDREFIDVLGILEEVLDTRPVHTREGTTISREIRIIDESMESIKVKLFKEIAKNFDSPLGVAIAINDIAVLMYGGKKILASNTATEILINPPTPEAVRLMEWYREMKDEESLLMSIECIDESLKKKNDKAEKNYVIKEVPSKSSSCAPDVQSGQSSCSFVSRTEVIPSESSQFRYSFTPIKEIMEKMTVNSVTDIIGIVVAIKAPISQKTWNGKDENIRYVLLNDENDDQIYLIISGWRSVEIAIKQNSILRAKNARLTTIGNDRALNCPRSSVAVDPDIPEAMSLRKIQSTTQKWMKLIFESEREFDEDPPEESEETKKVIHQGDAPIISETLPNSENEACRRLSSVRDIGRKPPGSKIDFIGTVVMVSLSDGRKVRETVKTSTVNIILHDKAGYEIKMTVLRPPGDDSIIRPNSILLVRDALVRSANGVRTLTCSHTRIIVDPQLSEIERFKCPLPNPRIPEMNSEPMEIENSINTARDRTSAPDQPASSLRQTMVHNGFYSVNEIMTTMSVGTIIDVIGRIVQLNDPISRMTQNGKVVTEVTLTDDGCSEIVAAIWGAGLDESTLRRGSVLLVKKAKVISYNDKNRLTCFRNNISIDPEIPETYRLKDPHPIVPQVNEFPSNTAPTRTNTTINGNETFNRNLHVNACYRSINDIQKSISEGTRLDFIGLMIQMTDPVPRLTKDGSLLTVTEVTLTDDRCSEIVLAVWGPGLDRTSIPLDSVFLAKNATVILYNHNKRLTCLQSSVFIDPDIPEAHRLKFLSHNVAYSANNTVAARVGTTIGSNKTSNNGPLVKGSWRSINEIKSSETRLGTKLDFIGLFVRMRDAQMRTNKNGYPVTVTEVTLTDDKRSEITLAIWGPALERSRIGIEAVLLAKNATVILFNDERRLNCPRSEVFIDPDTPEAQRLRNLSSIVPEHAEIPAHKPVAEVEETFNRNVSANRVSPISGHWHSINEIKTDLISTGSAIDFIGLIVQMTDPQSRMTKSGKPVTVTEITLTDDKSSEIVLAIFGDGLEQSDVRMNSVLLVKKAVVIWYNNEKRLNCPWSSVIIDPDIPEVHRLKNLPAMVPEVTTVTRVGSTNTKIISVKKEPGVTCNWRSISEIESTIPEGTTIDFLGCVVSVKAPKTITGHGGNVKTMTEVSLRDTRNSRIVLVVWGPIFDPSSNPIGSVLLVKNAQVKLFNECKRLMCHHTAVTIDPDVPEAHRLKEGQMYDRLYGISEITMSIKVGSTVDVIGLAAYVQEPKSITIGGHTEIAREITLADDGSFKIDVLIWGEDADNTLELRNSVLLLKDATVIFHEAQKKLSLRRDSVFANPNIPECNKFQQLIEACAMETQAPETQQMDDAIPPISRIEMSTIRTQHCYCPISEILDNIPLGMSVDVLAVVMHRGPLIEVSEDGKSYSKRTIELLDQTERMISMTISGPTVETIGYAKYQIVECLNVSVCEFENKNHLCFTETHSTLKIEPDVETAKRLRKWFDTVGRNRIVWNPLHSRTLPVNTTFPAIEAINEKVSHDALINVLGVVQHLEKSVETEETGVPTFRTDIQIVDESRSSICMKILGENAHIIGKPGIIVAGINVRVHVQDDQKTLVHEEQDSSLFVEPSIKRTEQLRAWYELNAIDNSLVESTLPITPYSLVFRNPSSEHINALGVLMQVYGMERTEDSGALTHVSRRIVIMDDRQDTMNLMVFGEKARDFDVPERSILLVTHLRISTEDQRKACSSPQSEIFVNPTDPKIQENVKRIQRWLERVETEKFLSLLDNTIAPIAAASVINSTMNIKTRSDKCILETIKVEPKIEPNDISNVVRTDDKPEDQSCIVSQPEMGGRTIEDYLGDEHQEWDDWWEPLC